MAEDRVICDACHREIAADASGRTPALCPHCGAMRIIDDVEEEQAAEASPARETPELEERRIRQIVRSRRAIVRTRGWYIAGMLACIVLAVQQFAWFVAAMVRGQWDMQQLARVSLAAVLLAMAVLLRERVKRLSTELRHSALPEPATPPDFTSLSDGSQQVRNLEEMEGEK